MGVPAAVPLGSPEPSLSHCHWAVRRVNRRRPKWNTECAPSPLCKPHALHAMSRNVLLPRRSRGHASPGRAGGEVQSTQPTSSAEGPTHAGVGAWPGTRVPDSDSPDGQCGLWSSRGSLCCSASPQSCFLRQTGAQETGPFPFMRIHRGFRSERLSVARSQEPG